MTAGRPANLRNAILDALAGGPMTSGQLAVRVERTVNQVSSLLTAMTRAGALDKRGGHGGVYALHGGGSVPFLEEDINLPTMEDVLQHSALIEYASEDLSEQFKCRKLWEIKTRRECMACFCDSHLDRRRIGVGYGCRQGARFRVEWAFELEATKDRIDGLLLLARQSMDEERTTPAHRRAASSLGLHPQFEFSEPGSGS